MENSPPKTPWHKVYQEIASLLHDFYLSFRDKTGYELYQLLTSTPAYGRHNLWLENITRNTEPSIDPIQLFVSFSRSGQKEQLRVEIINIVLKFLNPQASPWEHIDFDGCPTPVAIKLQFVRPVPVQKRIWDVFSNIMVHGRSSLSDYVWNEMRSWRGIETPSFTIFLFWIEADEFIPLDSNTQIYLEAGGVVPPNSKNSFYTFAIYTKLLENKRIRNYIRLSQEAFYFNSNIQLFRSRFRNGMFNLNNNNTTGFRLTGIKLLEKNNAVHKVLQPDYYYPFDGAMKPVIQTGEDFVTLKQFEYRPSPVEDVYHLGNLKVNLTAIVGKNGSGKSTLLDLLMMGIYNLSLRLGLLEEVEDNPVEKLNIEVYWFTDTLYKLVFDQDIRLYAFETDKQSNGHMIYTLNPNELPFTYFNFTFFYSILVNYSHYALNSNDHPVDWITPLSHKNDGYVVPTGINPQRTGGNIDVNTEKTLLNTRLLQNLLELHEPDFPLKSFRCIDSGKSLQSFSIIFDAEKSDKKVRALTSSLYGSQNLLQLFISEIERVFELPEEYSLDLVYRDAIRHYMVAKLLSMIIYPGYRDRYKQFFDNILKNYSTSLSDIIPESDIEMALRGKIELLVQEVKTDKSHVAIKFKQAMNCLKHIRLQEMLMQCLQTGTPIDLDAYSRVTEDIINRNQEFEISIGELLPPAVFKLEFFLNDTEKSSFSKASSGEYQLVSVLSSLLYHIRNIDSIEGADRYNHIAILLDEIELYFHPNMQRLFVNKLIDALANMKETLKEVRGIHILFSTHSPFILSDIQQDKILKLEEGKLIQYENGYNTFAANLHDLLADEFFLQDGFMGAFAKKKIETVINALNYSRTQHALRDLKSNHKEYHYLHTRLTGDIAMYDKALRLLGFWDHARDPETWKISDEQESLAALIDAIGEPLIKDNLRSMYRTVFEVNDDEREKARLQALRLIRDYNFNTNELT